MNMMVKRSSAIPKFTAKTGLVAVATIIAAQRENAVSTDIGLCGMLDGIAGQSDADALDERVADMTISFPVTEIWDGEKHLTELRKLVIKKSVSSLSSTETARLKKLQDMRRETLPLAQSYDEFIREHERQEELEDLVNRLAEYSRKYEVPCNV